MKARIMMVLGSKHEIWPFVSTLLANYLVGPMVYILYMAWHFT